MASRDELLADLVLDDIVWLELVDEETLHPDTAVNMLEGVSAALNTLGASDRLWLLDRIRARAAAEQRPRAKEALEALAGYLLDG